MAKLLKFGIGYLPKKIFTNSKTGEKTEMSCVSLSIFTDEKSGAAAFSQIQGFMKGNATFDSKDGTIFIIIPEEKFDIFINGKLFDRILSTIEKTTGYVADSKSIANLGNRFQIAKDEALSADKNGVATISSKYIQDLIAGLEKDFNDPRFQQIMNSIQRFSNGGFSPIGGGGSNGSYNSDDVVYKETQLAVGNVIRILAQWNKAGRQGVPTYLATANQWDRYFGGTVRNGALKIYIVRPDKVSSVSPNTVTKQLGINPNAASAGGALGRGVNSIARGGGMTKWRGVQTAYAMTCYYDISDVDGVDPNLLTGNTANYYDPDSVSANTADSADTNGDIVQTDSAKNDVQDNSVIMTEDILNKKLLKLAQDRNDNGLLLSIRRDGALGGLKYLVEHLKEITRDHDMQRKRATVEQVLFIILRHYNIFENEALYLLKKYVSILGTPNGKVNMKLIVELFSFSSIITSLIDGIKEVRGGSLTLADVIGYLGFTVEEFKMMPKNEEEAEARLNGVKENFIKIFNKLIIK